jgi:PAS domain S-box-containing protein
MPESVRPLALEHFRPPPQPGQVLPALSAAQTLLQRALPSELGQALGTSLALAGKAMQADRAYIFRSVDMVFLDNTHEWCAPNIQPMQAILQKVPFSDGDPFWVAFLQRGSVVVQDLSQLAKDNPMRTLLEWQGIQSIIAVPLWAEGQVGGFVGFDFVAEPRPITPELDLLLRAFASTIALALQNQSLARALERRESALALTEARLTAAISRAPKLLVETDDDGVITAFFQSDPIIFALKPQDVIGARHEQVLPDNVVAIVRAAMAEVDAQGWSQHHIYPLEVAGVQKWFRLSAMPRQTNRQGLRSGYIFVVTDVSETHRQEARIRQLVHVAEVSTNLIILTDKDFRITWCNPAALERTGYAGAAVIGQNAVDVLGLGHADPAGAAQIVAQIDAGQCLRTEMRARSRRGVSYWLDLNIQPMHSPEGGLQAYMVVGVDITLHKLAEARALRDKVRTLDASKEGYAIFWPDGRVAFMNIALRRRLGVPEADALDGLMWTDIAHSGFTQRITDILPVLIAEGYWSGELVLRGTDGQDRHSDLSLTVQDDGSIFLIVRDTTERRQAEAERARLNGQLQIAQSRQVMAHMAAGLAHDFANLMAVIAGSVALLEHTGDPVQDAALARISYANTQAQALVQDLMNFGLDAPRRADLDLHDVVARAVDLIRPSLTTPIHVTAAPHLPKIMADPTQVMQIVVNLVLNADQAILSRPHPACAEEASDLIKIDLALLTPTDASVQLGRLIPGQDCLALTVTDTGPGIPPTRLSEVFAPFVSGRARRGAGAAGGATGLGLGLAIIAHIVESHGAALSVLPMTEGTGTSIRVWFPTCDGVAANSLPAVQTAPAEYPLQGLNVLLVDDDDAVLQTLSALLSQAGAETASCDNPLDALSAVHEDPEAWDVVVTDYDMDAMTGLDLARQLVQTQPNLKIILVSGASELQNATASLQGSLVAMLRKPISGPELIAVLLREKLLERGRKPEG